MKFLGQFSSEEGDKYINLLKENGVTVETKDVFEDRVNARWLSSSLGHSVGLFVTEKDYKTAVSLIKGFEQQKSKRVRIAGKEADKAMWKLLLVGTLALILFCGYCARWW